MSDTTSTAPAATPVTPTPAPAPVLVTTITRDVKDAAGTVTGQTPPMEFWATPFKRGDFKKKNYTYPCPNTDKLSLSDLTAFFGEEWIKNVASAKIGLQMQSYWFDASPTNTAEDDVTGPMDLTKFTTFVKNLEARGESISDLQDQATELTLKLPTMDAATAQKSIMQLIAWSTQIQQMKDSKQAKAEAKAAEELAARAKADAAKAVIAATAAPSK